MPSVALTRYLALPYARAPARCLARACLPRLATTLLAVPVCLNVALPVLPFAVVDCREDACCALRARFAALAPTPRACRALRARAPRPRAPRPSRARAHLPCRLYCPYHAHALPPRDAAPRRMPFADGRLRALIVRCGGGGWVPSCPLPCRPSPRLVRCGLQRAAPAARALPLPLPLLPLPLPPARCVAFDARLTPFPSAPWLIVPTDAVERTVVGYAFCGGCCVAGCCWWNNCLAAPFAFLPPFLCLPLTRPAPPYPAQPALALLRRNAPCLIAPPCSACPACLAFLCALAA